MKLNSEAELKFAVESMRLKRGDPAPDVHL
jgi:hypothetical protein